MSNKRYVMGEIKQYESSTEIQKELPQSGDIIIMNALDGWDNVTEEQRAYLCTYFDTFPKKIKACMQAGISTGLYNKWLNSDKEFVDLMKLIKFIHLEELKDIEYAESYTDSKTRARFLKSMESGGYGSNQGGSTHNNLNINVKGMKEANEILDNLQE